MHKTHQVLPRLRTSFPGSISKPGHCPAILWYAGLAVCGLLLVAGLVHVAGFVKAPGAAVASQPSKYFTKGKDFEPLAAAVEALQKKAAQAELLLQLKQLQQETAEDGMQQLQQGTDAMSVAVSAMTRTLREQSSWLTGANLTAAMSAGAAAPQVDFFDISKDVQSTADAISKGPEMHGHMVKTGPTDLKYWMKNYSDTRLDSFMSWRLNRTKSGGAGPATADSYTCAAADHPPMPFPGCHVFVNHK